MPIMTRGTRPAGRTCLLDGLTCLLAGLHAQPIADYRQVLALNSAGKTGLAPIGAGCEAGLFDAANLYAQAANILDFDDCYRHAPSHPGATIIGPALACAHVLKRNGRDMLLAIIKAYEASLRIGAALCPSDATPSKDIGYATWQIFDAYIATGLLLKLDHNQWIQGFGLASQQAPVPMIVRTNPRSGYTWLKNTYGAAAAAGVMSAFLAKQGYVGDQRFFSEEFGFWKTYGSDQFRPQCMNTLPGDDWLIRHVEFKPWACCRWSHPALEAILHLKPAIDLGNLQSIDLYSFKEFCGTLDSPYPANMVDAQYDALRRVDMSIPTRVVVKQAGEPDREVFISDPMGSERRGIADMAQTQDKFRAALAPLMPARQIEQIIDRVATLESCAAQDLMAAAFAQA